MVFGELGQLPAEFGRIFFQTPQPALRVSQLNLLRKGHPANLGELPKDATNLVQKHARFRSPGGEGVSDQ